MADDPVVTVIEILCSTNRGSLPSTRQEWIDTAERLRVDLSYHSCSSALLGVTIEDVICIKDTTDIARLNRRTAHEMAEYLLLSERADPICWHESRHQVAQQVERFY